MKKIAALIVFSSLFSLTNLAQYKSLLSEQAWVDSVFNSLDNDQKIAQLMVIRAHSNLGASHVEKVIEQISKYNVGALCFFQGGPVRQANLTNHYQSIARTPLMVTIDAEWGLGMRLDSVIKYPYQLTLGALSDTTIVYKMGLAVGEQLKRLGVHVNYAPVVDINNNPNNPVIGYRSFGEDKDKVSALGVAYMRGMQAAGIMACAKHFPGHGDTEVDSHLDLPVIAKTRTELDSLELQPFEALFRAGVGSVMIAHLYIPSIDKTANLATSLSKNNVTDLLKISMGYNGLTFTDALEMKGVTKFFPGGEAAVQAIIAGNDMLCLPEDVGDAIDAVKKAIRKDKLSWDNINQKVKRVLTAKYRLGLNQSKPVQTNNLLFDLNLRTNATRYDVAQNAMTVLKASNGNLPALKNKKVAYVGIGTTRLNQFGKRLNADINADSYFFSFKDGVEQAKEITNKINKAGYDAVIIGVHDYGMRPANNYNISAGALELWQKLQGSNAVTILFGNVYAAKLFCTAENLVAAYENDDIFQNAAADLVTGRIGAKGKLPVTVCDIRYGEGVAIKATPRRGTSIYDELYSIDSIMYDAIARKAFPGGVVLAAKGGELIYHKAFGHYDYEGAEPVTLESIYDLASVTKISATTISVMKLYEQGKLKLDKTLGDYLPWVRGTDKEKLVIKNILLHQAGLNPFIPFYRETIDSGGYPLSSIYSLHAQPGYIRVAENLYMRNDWNDTMYSRILFSPLGPMNRYVYSDNDFIFLGKVIEEISGMTLDKYVRKTFYEPMGLVTTGFRPRTRFPLQRIVPTEAEPHFRRQLIRGDVHDEGASMFGGVAGHAGLFSTAYDLSMLYQMLLNGGELHGERFFKPETIKYFTSYQSGISRRGLGFDKPEKDNASRDEPYPSKLASPKAFGHTGFTGTCVWVDPEQDLVYIFLSNRVFPTRNNPRLSQLNVRGNIQDEIYEVLKEHASTAAN